MNLPQGARAILELRQAGQRPKDPVLVSLIGRLPYFDGPCVIAEPGTGYDWSFICGLETHIWLREGIDARRTFIDLAKAGAALLQVWDVNRAAGGFLAVDPPARVEQEILRALDAGDDRAMVQAFETRFNHRDVDLWLSPFGPIMRASYAQTAAPILKILSDQQAGERMLKQLPELSLGNRT